MYTARPTELGKLRGYHVELTHLYRAALKRRAYPAARAIYDRRARVRRAILIHEEWSPAVVETVDYDDLLAG